MDHRLRYLQATIDPEFPSNCLEGMLRTGVYHFAMGGTNDGDGDVVLGGED